MKNQAAEAAEEVNIGDILRVRREKLSALEFFGSAHTERVCMHSHGVFGGTAECNGDLMQKNVFLPDGDIDEQIIKCGLRAKILCF